MGKYRARVVGHLVLPAQAMLPAGLEHVLRQRGRPVPPPVAVRLLIDTGSKRTTLVAGILRHLNPLPGLRVRIATALQAGRARLFWVKLAFPEARLAPFELVQVARLTMPSGLAMFHGVLGRDLLRQWESFDYEGRSDRYTLRDTPGLFGWLRKRL
jgi:hypothetical protein